MWLGVFSSLLALEQVLNKIFSKLGDLILLWPETGSGLSKLASGHSVGHWHLEPSCRLEVLFTDSGATIIGSHLHRQVLSPVIFQPIPFNFLHDFNSGLVFTQIYDFGLCSTLDKQPIPALRETAIKEKRWLVLLLGLTDQFQTVWLLLLVKVCFH